MSVAHRPEINHRQRNQTNYQKVVRGRSLAPAGYEVRANLADQKSTIARRACELIATIIGVTVGTLNLSCSRLEISLRRPRVRLLPPRTAAATAKTAGAATATFTISMTYRGQEQDTALPLTPEMVSQLALEASSRDQKIGELAKDLLEAVTQKGLFQEVLGE
jgi:hypothetical protein